MGSRIKVVERWDKYLITPFNFLKGEYPTIIEKGKENCWLRVPTDNEYLHYDWEEPTENIEVVSTFQGWLDYLKMPKCFYCGEVTSEEYICEGGCGELRTKLIVFFRYFLFQLNLYICIDVQGVQI